MALFSPVTRQQPKSAVHGARLLQRACDCGEKSAGECQTCRGRTRVQRKSAGGTQLGSPVAFNAASQLTQGGEALPLGLRHSLGSLYGAAFADVRVHHDSTSHAAANEIDARAFTLGQHIHFAAGAYRPNEREGQRLIAHELGHTLQQRGAFEGSNEALEIGGPDSPLEQEADTAADAVMGGRPAHVAAASERGLQTKLLQRQPVATGGGIGTRAGGSETATIDRKIDENTVVHITRTVTEKPCTEERVTKSTPTDKIFYWDEKANAVGLRYSICNGRVQLSTKGEISYDKVIQSAKDLLTSLQNNPALGNDIPGLLNSRLDAATISTTGDVTLTVDGILQASVQGGSTVGTAGQQYNVRGVLKITPKGVSFTVTGGVDFSKSPLQQSTNYTLQGKTATEHFSVTLRYDQIDTTPVGGASTTQRKVTGELDVPLPDIGPLKGTTIGGSVTVNPDRPGEVTPGISFKGTFGGPEKTPAVRCFQCDCPPPQPEYSCTKAVTAHTRTVEDQPAKDRMVKLFYNYNSTVPANEGEFTGNVSAIASLVGEGFKVEHIRGYASPEGSLDSPKPPVPGFKGNIDLSQRRADHTRGRVAEKAIGATLPAAEGRGELLGDLDGSGDTPDKDLTPDLVKLLEPLNDEQRLDTLGVDDATRSDKDQRAKALADIQAFVDGRDRTGLALARRPRWEKIFPFLRRVEVSLHHEAVTHEEAVPASSSPGCSPEDLAFAKANLPPLPPQRRVPQQECGR
jgi:hypothetical protein